MRSFAIIPAAGHSRRMGRHKLLLPLDDGTVLERVLARWLASPVSEVVVVARRSDQGVLDICRNAGVHVVTPDVDPSEMKVSVQHGLSFVASRFAPREADVWLTAPADCPGLSSTVIAALLSTWDHSRPAIVVPSHGGRHGHPVLFPWFLAGEVANLGSEQGVNALIGSHPLREIPCEDPSVLDDLDTPEDYRRLLSGGQDRQDNVGRP